MKLAKKLILAVGASTAVYLLWKLDPRQVLGLVRRVGWGMVLILAQETVPHLFNALAWSFSHPSKEARAVGLPRFYLHRVIGDAVNYLTPSATIAGEFARAALVDHRQALEVRVSGVLVAKCSQALAQNLFVLFGLAIFLRGQFRWLAPYEGALRALAWTVFGAILSMALWELLRSEKPRRPAVSGTGPRAMRAMLVSYFDRHPGRLALSITFFILGYAWSAVEVYLGCRLLGLRVGVRTAMAIEVLSNLVDSVLFFVPAKVGTQEGGKTAIFTLLGLPPRVGLAFGVVRHLREFAWSGLGFYLYSRAVAAEPPAAGAGALGGVTGLAQERCPPG